MHPTLASMLNHRCHLPAPPSSRDDQGFNQPAANLGRAPLPRIRIGA